MKKFSLCTLTVFAISMTWINTSLIGAYRYNYNNQNNPMMQAQRYNYN